MVTTGLRLGGTPGSTEIFNWSNIFVLWLVYCYTLVIRISNCNVGQAQKGVTPMPRDHGRLIAEPAPRSLSCEEIDERIQRLTSWVASGSDDGQSGQDLEPRWITPAELVRRMRPFLVYN